MFSTAEAILCGTYTPLGQVQIGPIDSLGGQLKAYQLPSGIISTIKLADLAVTVDKLAASSVINSKVAGDAGIIESKLSLAYGTAALNTAILLRELASNKGLANGYCDLDAGVHIPLTRLADLANAQIAAAAAIIESKLSLDYSTTSLNTAILLREESANKGVASGYCDLDAGVHIPLTRLADLANAQIAAAAGIVESKLSLAYGTAALNTAILLRELASNKGIASGYCDLDAAIHVPLSRLSGLTNAQIAAAAAIIESKLALTYGTQALHDDIQTRTLQTTYAAHDHSVGDPTQVDHANVTNVLTSQHHVRYADSEAKAACVSDAVYGSGWNAVTTVAPSKNAVYDEMETRQDENQYEYILSMPVRRDGVEPMLDLRANNGYFYVVGTGWKYWGFPLHLREGTIEELVVRVYGLANDTGCYAQFYYYDDASGAQIGAAYNDSIGQASTWVSLVFTTDHTVPAGTSTRGYWFMLKTMGDDGELFRVQSMRVQYKS